MKRIKRISSILIYVLLMAMILAWISPSFADDEEIAQDYFKTSITPSADINWSDAPGISATSAILIDGGSGEVLYEKDADEQRTPASITKILTALIAIENLNMDDEITVPDDLVVDMEGTNIKLQPGEVLTVEQLLYAALLSSANDAADTLAIAIAGSKDAFSEMMNERAAECGAVNSNFTSPSGLVDSKDKSHVSTAYDIAMIAREAMNNSTFREIVSTYRYTISATNKSDERKLKNTNQCLYSKNKTVEVNGEKRSAKYDGTTGVKTGYTESAGYCFCGSAKDDDSEFIAVVLNSEESEQRFADAITLWDYGFSKYYTYVVASAGEYEKSFKVWQGAKGRVHATLKRDMDITVNDGTSEDDMKLKVKKTDTMIKAPIKKGQVLAYVGAYDEDGNLVAVSDLVAEESVKKGGILSYIGISDDHRTGFIIGLIIILILLILIRIRIVYVRRRRRRRRQAQRNRNIRRREWEKERHPFDD